MTVHERIIIENFAGIKHLDLTLGSINLLIGPQATGKSVCAKVMFYFKIFLRELSNAAINGQTKRQFDSAFLKKFKTYFPPSDLGEGNFRLRYEIATVFIQIEGSKAKISLSYSDYYKKEFNVWMKKQKEIESVENFLDPPKDDIKTQFYIHQANKLGMIAGCSQFFIPAGRSFFAILQGTVFSLLSNNVTIDPFLIEFGSLYQMFKLLVTLPLSNKDEKLESKIDSLTEAILRGKFIRNKKQESLLLEDGRKVSLNNSSSGQQELLPLAIGLKGVVCRGADYGYTIYIEEPEAHLFPSAQKKVVELMATIFNMSTKPVQFIITTHSPYLLTAFNNLIHAGNVASSLTAENLTRLNELVPTEQQLKTENVKVYALGYGTCDDLMSKETGLISTNEIDQVSDELAIQFDNILNIE